MKAVEMLMHLHAQLRMDSPIGIIETDYIIMSEDIRNLHPGPQTAFKGLVVFLVYVGKNLENERY